MLASLIYWHSLQATSNNDCDEEEYSEEDDDEDTSILVGSELEVADGCLYRLIGMTDSQRVLAQCCHPRWNNELVGKETISDVHLAKELVQHCLNG